MIHTISSKITEFLVKNSICQKNELHWKVCCYGMEVMLSTILNCLIVFFLGVFFNMFIESIIFLIAFTPIRIYSGGYHADTYLKCNTIFGCMVFGCFALYKYFEPLKWIGMVVVCAIQLLLCIFFSPIENKNKRLTDRQKKVYRKRAIMALIILSILLLLSEMEIVGNLKVIIYAVLLNILFMFFGIIRRKKE